MRVYLFKFAGFVLTSMALSLLALPGASLPESFVVPKYVIGMVFFLTGVFFLRRNDGKQKGILVNPRWAAVTGDMISIFFLSFAAYCVWAAVLYQGWRIEIYLYAHNMSAMDFIAFTYIPAVAVMAFFISVFEEEKIMVDETGITIRYPGKTIFMAWKEIEVLRIRQTYTVAGGEDFAAPRDMQRVLQVEGTQRTMVLYEPGLKQTKRNITEILKKYAPKDLQDDIAQIEKNW